MARLNRGTLAAKVQVRRLVGVNDNGMRVGETHHRAKLTDKDVDQIHALHEMGLGYRTIAAKFDDIPGGISWLTVRDIIKFRIRAQQPTRKKTCG